MNHLVPCHRCDRHVRVLEVVCPFCGVSLDLAGSPPPNLPRARLGRAATFAFGASVLGAAVLASACGGDTTDSGPDAAAGSSQDGASQGGGGGDQSGGAGNSAGGGQPVYGAPPADIPDWSAADAGGPVPIYGAAPAN